MIQVAMETHMAAGISEFFIITSPEKPQLEHFLTGRWKPPAFPFERDLNFFRKLRQCRLVFAVQDWPTGVANAIAMAEDFVEEEPFVCIMPDCILFSDVSHTRQALDVFEKHGLNVIGTIAVQSRDVGRFGNVGILSMEKLDGNAFLITSLSDKTPEPIKAKPGETVYKGFGGGVYLPDYFGLISSIRPTAAGARFRTAWLAQVTFRSLSTVRMNGITGVNRSRSISTMQDSRFIRRSPVQRISGRLSHQV